jgi:hypothetical protein
MGEDFLSAKREKFNHESDEAVKDQFKSENLLSKLPESLNVEIRCIRTSNIIEITPGETVALAALDDSGVSVFIRNEVIGKVKSEDAQKLRTLFETTVIKMFVATIISVGKMTPTFSVVIQTEPKN